MVACVIPHEFHGINTEVTVTESSVVRLNSLLSYPCFLYILPNMLPVRMMLIYWSAVAKFMNKPEHTVDETRLKRFFIKRTKTDVILPSIPLAVMAPPKHMEHSISQIVFVMPAIPRVATSSVRAALPVSRLVLP